MGKVFSLDYQPTNLLVNLTTHSLTYLSICSIIYLLAHSLTHAHCFLLQVLQFEPHPSGGDCPLLSPGFTHSLLEQLESARIQLFGMLMSRHVQHVKAEVAMWAEKLGGVSEVLQLWLCVQELWLSLQAVFSDPRTKKVSIFLLFYSISTTITSC